MGRLRKRQINQKIDAMVQRIVERFSPAKIFLFGSYATGTASPDSDVDLLVVMSVRGSRHKKAVEIGVALHDIEVAKDVIVVTPEEFEWRKDVIGTIEWPAVREGQLLYAKSA
jgi:predicted nucleotidyltransferase